MVRDLEFLPSILNSNPTVYYFIFLLFLHLMAGYTTLADA
jgi:hypothetical protein